MPLSIHTNDPAHKRFIFACSVLSLSHAFGIAGLPATIFGGAAAMELLNSGFSIAFFVCTERAWIIDSEGIVRVVEGARRR